MVESMASTNLEEDEDIIEMLLDHPFAGFSRIKAMTFCEELEILSLAFSDGTVHNYHFNIQVDIFSENDDEDDDEYG